MSLLTQLATIDDPRRDINKKHELLDTLFLTVGAVLSGAEGWKDIKEFGDDKSSGQTICTAPAARRVAPRDGRNEYAAEDCSEDTRERGDYTLSLKANHKTFQREIQAYFHKVRRDDADKLAVHEEVDGGAWSGGKARLSAGAGE